jgi:hypothetical protein
MIIDVRLTFGVGDSMPRFTISIEEDNLVFSVVYRIEFVTRMNVHSVDEHTQGAVSPKDTTLVED